MGTYSQKLADFVCGLKFQDLPEEIRRRVRFSALDNIGVTLAGHRHESARVAVDLVRSYGGTPESTVFGYEDKLPAHASALANSVAAYSTELDDHISHTHSLNHPGVVTWPAAFAVAEKAGASGEKLMVSAVIGYELTSRLNVATTDLDRGFHVTALCGNFGAAATTASLLGLTSDQLANAFGICGGMAAGSSEFRYTGAWTKPLQAGWACHGGIISAELALRGFTGPSTILEGKAGFFRSYVGEGNYNLEPLTAGLGRDFEFRDIIYKPFACKGEMHSPLTAAQQLLSKHRVKPDQIDKVIVRTRESLVHLGTIPAELRLRPKTTLDAQYSLPYSLATFLYFGRAFLDEFSEKARSHPGVLDLVSRVHCIGDPEMDRRYPQEEPAEVTLRMKDGTEYTAAVDFAKGSLGSPLTEEELREKFRVLTDGILAKESAEAIIHMTSNLEKLRNVRELIKAIAPLPR